MTTNDKKGPVTTTETKAIVSIEDDQITKLSFFDSDEREWQEHNNRTFVLRGKGSRHMLKATSVPVYDIPSDSQIKKITFTTSDDRDWQDQKSQIFLLQGKGSRHVLKATEAPAYLLSGGKKKMDITDDWNKDFSTAAQKVRSEGKTTCDFDRLFTLWNGVGNVCRSAYPMIEIGVLRGGASALLAQAGRHFGKTGKIFSCDTFEGHVEIDEELDGTHTMGKFGDRTSYTEVKDYLAQYQEVLVIQGDINETAPQLETDKFSLVHLDVDVYKTTVFCLDYFSKRMIPGGIIIVDDFGVKTCPGVKKAVDDFMKDRTNFVFIYLLSGQAQLVRL